MTTATQQQARDFLPDRRRYETHLIGRAIFDEIRDLLPSDTQDEVHDRLMETIHRNRLLLVRDEERDRLGLEPCDDKGWTVSERLKLEHDKIAAMNHIASFAMKITHP